MLEHIREGLGRFSKEEGATAVEYGIMVALIAVVIIAAVFFIGQELNSDFSCVGDTMAGAGSSLSVGDTC